MPAPLSVLPPLPPPNKPPSASSYEKVPWNRTGMKSYFGINQNWIVYFLSNPNPTKSYHDPTKTFSRPKRNGRDIFSL